MIQATTTILSSLPQIVLFALISPIVVGLRRWIETRLQLRKGSPPWQLYIDLIKLLRIDPGPRPETTSWVYAIAPFTAFVCYACLSWATPPFYLGFVLLDLIAVVYLLGLARFILALAGMDTGTPFGGMGSSREMFISVLAEPVLISIILALTLQLHTTDLKGFLTGFPLSSTVFQFAALLLLWFALAFVAIMDNSFLPVDNPSTQLELTMIQKALPLEYSARNLALIEWGEAMRLTFFLTLLGDLLMLMTRTIAVSPNILVSVLYIAWLLIGVVFLALFEIVQVKLRLQRVTVLWIVVLLLAAAAAFFVSVR